MPFLFKSDNHGSAYPDKLGVDSQDIFRAVKPNLSEFSYPTADPGRVIPKVFGTVKLTGNVIWWGGVTADPIYTESSAKGSSVFIWLCLLCGYGLCHLRGS
jgi:hypothetical protein